MLNKCCLMHRFNLKTYNKLLKKTLYWIFNNLRVKSNHATVTSTLLVIEWILKFIILSFRIQLSRYNFLGHAQNREKIPTS